jgi:hypothetical protein
MKQSTAPLATLAQYDEHPTFSPVSPSPTPVTPVADFKPSFTTTSSSVSIPTLSTAPALTTQPDQTGRLKHIKL